MKWVHWKCFFLFLSIISVMNSSVFAVRSLLAVAICSNFSSARRIGKQLPAVPTSVMPGRQPGAMELHYLHLSPSSPTHTGSVCHLWTKLCCWWHEIPSSLPGDSSGPVWLHLLSMPQRGKAVLFYRMIPQYGLLERYCLAEALCSYSLNLLSIGRFRPKVVVN